MTPAPKLIAGLAFTASAGFIDAVGFVELGGYFVSFVSGNTTRLGAALGLGEWGAVAVPLALTVMFFAGGLAGSLLSGIERWGSVLTLQFILALLAVALAPHAIGSVATWGTMALAVAGGAQNAVLPQVGAARLGATFVTGTLFAASQDLARALRRQAPPWRWVQHLAIWAALSVGAVIGASAHAKWGPSALIMPGLVYAAFLIKLAVAVRPSAPAKTLSTDDLQRGGAQR